MPQVGNKGVKSICIQGDKQHFKPYFKHKKTLKIANN